MKVGVKTLESLGYTRPDGENHVILRSLVLSQYQRVTDGWTDRKSRLYIWYSEEGPGRAAAASSPFLVVPNVTAHPSAASVPCTFMWHYTYLSTVIC